VKAEGCQKAKIQNRDTLTAICALLFFLSRFSFILLSLPSLSSSINIIETFRDHLLRVSSHIILNGKRGADFFLQEI